MPSSSVAGPVGDYTRYRVRDITPVRYWLEHSPATCGGSLCRLTAPRAGLAAARGGASVSGCGSNGDHQAEPVLPWTQAQGPVTCFPPEAPPKTQMM